MKRNSIDATVNGNNNTSQVSMNKPQTAEGVSRRRKRQQAYEANGNSKNENYFDLNDQKEQLINELKRASIDTNPIRHTSQIHYNAKKRDYQKSGTATATASAERKQRN